MQRLVLGISWALCWPHLPSMPRIAGGFSVEGEPLPQHEFAIDILQLMLQRGQSTLHKIVSETAAQP